MSIHENKVRISSDFLAAEFNPENQQLVSLKLGGKEFFHGGGKKESEKSPADRRGWQNSEIIMFPIVGPPEGFRLRIRESSYPLDQHGIARCVGFEVEEQESDRIVFLQRYEAEKVKNPKHEANPEHPEFIEFPYSYELRKEFVAKENSLETTITVKNASELEMPFQLGWHPAFKLIENGKIKGEGFEYSLRDIQAASRTGALHVPSRILTYGNTDEEITVESEMELMQIWSPGDMICIEPVTSFGTSGFKGFDSLKGIKLGEIKEVGVNITINLT